MAKALIVVDVQQDFTEGGSLAVQGGKAVAEKIDKLLRKPHEYDVVVATLDYHDRNGDNGGHFGTPENGGVDFLDRWPAHCVEGTPGAAFEAPLKADQFLEIFTKGKGEPAYSGFQGKGMVTGAKLLDFLNRRKVDEVAVVGLAFDYCVKATAADAAREGFATKVLKPFTASVNPAKDGDVELYLGEMGVQISA